MTQVCDLGFKEFTLAWFQLETCFIQFGEDTTKPTKMFFWIVRKDDEIIQIDDTPTKV